MGRARQRQTAVATTSNFDALLGVRRGGVGEDSIASTHPNTNARRRQRELLEQLQRGEVTDTLTELRSHIGLLRDAVALIDRPLLRELAQGLIDMQLRATCAAAEKSGRWLSDLFTIESAWNELSPSLPTRLHSYLWWVTFSAAIWGESARLPTTAILEARAHADATGVVQHMLLDHLSVDGSAYERLCGHSGNLATPTWAALVRAAAKRPMTRPPSAADREWLQKLVGTEPSSPT